VPIPLLPRETAYAAIGVFYIPTLQKPRAPHSG
jgi:hypothetical protein